MACLKDNGTHPELRHWFKRSKIKDWTGLKTSINKRDGMLLEGQLAGRKWSTISVSVGRETGSSYWKTAELAVETEASRTNWGSGDLRAATSFFKTLQKILSQSRRRLNTDIITGVNKWVQYKNLWFLSISRDKWGKIISFSSFQLSQPVDKLVMKKIPRNLQFILLPFSFRLSTCTSKHTSGFIQTRFRLWLHMP